MVLKHLTHHNYSIYYLNAVVLCVWSGWLGVLYLVLFIILSSNNNCGKSLVILSEKKNYLNATNINIATRKGSTYIYQDEFF
jgi:hypothetical protein